MPDLSVLASKTLALVALIFMLAGLVSTKPLSFSDLSVVFVSLGCFCSILSIPLYLNISRKSTAHEKAFALVAIMSVILLTAAIIVFQVVKVDFRLQDGLIGDATVVMIPGHGACWHVDSSSLLVIPVVTRIYGLYSACFLALSFVLFLLSVYVKNEYL